MATSDDAELERWVDEQLATLPAASSSPDPVRGLALFEARLAAARATRRRRYVLAAASVVAIGVFWATTAQREPAAADGPGSGVALTARGGDGGAVVIAPPDRRPVADFRLPAIDGGEATRSDYDGHVLLLNFWATWCGPCRIEMPWFSDFHAVFAARGLAVLGVSVDEEGWDAVRPFLEEHPVVYRVALADALDTFDGVEMVPTTWLVDRQGRVAVRHVGLVDRRVLDAEIRHLLAEVAE